MANIKVMLDWTCCISLTEHSLSTDLNILQQKHSESNGTKLTDRGVTMWVIIKILLLPLNRYQLPVLFAGKLVFTSLRTMPFHKSTQNALLCWIGFICLCICSAQNEDYDYASKSYDYGDQSEIQEDQKSPATNGHSPGHMFSTYEALQTKMEYEGIIICLLSVTAFICLIVWVLKSNFEERQQMKMRRDASIRNRTSFQGLEEQMQQTWQNQSLCYYFVVQLGVTPNLFLT